jgi:hypothetical protein
MILQHSLDQKVIKIIKEINIRFSHMKSNPQIYDKSLITYYNNLTCQCYTILANMSADMWEARKEIFKHDILSIAYDTLDNLDLDIDDNILETISWFLSNIT